MVLFCLAAILFPMGFSVNEIGGAPLQVSTSYKKMLKIRLTQKLITAEKMNETYACKIQDAW